MRFDFERFVSVTEVANLGNSAVQYFTAEHANRGNMIHSLCNAHLEVKEALAEQEYLSHTNREGVDDILSVASSNLKEWKETCTLYGYDGYVDSAEIFFEEVEFIPVLKEKRLYHVEEDYTGKPDLVGYVSGYRSLLPVEMLNGLLGIIDFKTSVNCYKEWDLQMAGYWGLCLNNGLMPSWAASVRIRKDGKKPLVNVLLERESDAGFKKLEKKLKEFREQLEKTREEYGRKFI